MIRIGVDFGGAKIEAAALDPEGRFQARDAIAPHVFSDVFDTPVRKALHEDSSGVRAAAWLWPVE
jgi:predicted NBD/HSP70 family sugar kinase